jgi:two-component sensor histidine kinase
MTFAGAGLSLFIAGLLYYLYRIKQKSNMQLRHLVDEKEWLLKEVHHRVKNNLQTVLSLLESQARTLSNDALYAIQDSQNRVYAMSLIHKKLYQSSEVASIGMEDYLRDLLQHLRQSLSDSKSIRFPLDLDPVKLDVSQAVPIGLIVNEAVTNAIKYAFPEKHERDQIAVSLKQRDNQVELRIEDNGVGFSSEMKEHSGSLGLKLMKGLTGDIDGDFQMKTSAGVSITVTFVANAPLQKMDGTTPPKLVLHQ